MVLPVTDSEIINYIKQYFSMHDESITRLLNAIKYMEYYPLVIALVGPAGSGKTTLANQIKKWVHDAYIVDDTDDGLEHNKAIVCMQHLDAEEYRHITFNIRYRS